jgi:hypothetical protein
MIIAMNHQAPVTKVSPGTMKEIFHRVRKRVLSSDASDDSGISTGDASEAKRHRKEEEKEQNAPGNGSPKTQFNPKIVRKIAIKNRDTSHRKFEKSHKDKNTSRNGFKEAQKTSRSVSPKIRNSQQNDKSQINNSQRHDKNENTCRVRSNEIPTSPNEQEIDKVWGAPTKEPSGMDDDIYSPSAEDSNVTVNTLPIGAADLCGVLSPPPKLGKLDKKDRGDKIKSFMRAKGSLRSQIKDKYEGQYFTFNASFKDDYHGIKFVFARTANHLKFRTTHPLAPEERGMYVYDLSLYSTEGKTFLQARDIPLTTVLVAENSVRHKNFCYKIRLYKKKNWNHQ